MIKISNLAIGYHNKVILKDIHLELKSKEFIGLLGPNGCGKSTLVKTILNIVPKIHGSIDLAKDFKNRLAYVPQKMKVNPSIPLTCQEFLKLKQLGFTDEEVSTSLESMGLSGFENKSIHEISGGQLQRLFLAFALLGKPKVIILDEATEGMDVDSLDKFYKLLKDYIDREDAILIYVSHDISAVSEHCNRVICLHHGIEYDGDPKSPNFHQCLHDIYGDKSLIHDHRH